MSRTQNIKIIISLKNLKRTNESCFSGTHCHSFNQRSMDVRFVYLNLVCVTFTANSVSLSKDSIIVDECVSISVNGKFEEGDRIAFSEDDCKTFVVEKTSYCESVIEVQLKYLTCEPYLVVLR